MTMILSLSSFSEPPKGVRRRELGCNLLQQVPKALVSCATTYSKNYGSNMLKSSNLLNIIFTYRGDRSDKSDNYERGLL